MPDITTELNNIMNARYGKDVRKSIHDGIKKVNDIVDDTGYSELIDIRKGADGKTYESAGEAVRSQIGSLSEDMITFGEEYRSVGEDPLTIGSLDPHKSYLIWSDVWKTISDISEELKNIGAPFLYLSSCVFIPSRARTYSDISYSVYMFIVYPSYGKAYSDIVLWTDGKLKKVASVGVTEETISELIDIRKGADGKTYESAGEAVRSQIGSLSEDMITFGEEYRSVGEDPLTIGSLDPHKSYLIWSDVWKTISDISEELKNIGAPFLYLSSCVFIPSRARTYSDISYSVYMFIVYPSYGKAYSDIVLWTDGKLKKVASVGVTEETIINCDNVSVIPTMHGVENIIVWGSTNDENRIVNITENNITISSNGTSTGNFGVCTRSVLPGNHISAFVYLNINVNSGSVSLFISGHKKSTGEQIYILIKTYKDDYNGFEYLDIVYHNIYNDLDLSKPLTFILSVNASKINDVEIITFQYNLSTFTDTKILGENLSETINKIDAELSNKMNIGSTVASDNTLISPDGNRFIPTISNDGIVSYTPIVPSKTLFIGNSLLLGWGTFGMCALDSSHDYYHYVSEYIKNIKSDATFDKISGTTFESATSEDAADSWMHDTLSEKLSQDIELVLIQLSDNVNTDEKNKTFKLTCAKLIQYIRTQCPKARVAWVSAWYYTSERQGIISEACEKYSAKFISITNLAVTENRGSIGDRIHKDDGSTVTVDSSGVASHPGNKGMRLIANRILYDLGISDTDTAYDESYDN